MLYRPEPRIASPIQSSFSVPVATDVYFDSAKTMTMWGSAGAGNRGVTLASWIRLTDGTHPGGSASHYLGCQQTTGGLAIRRSYTGGAPRRFWTHINGSSGSDAVRTVGDPGQVGLWQLVIARLLQRTNSEIWIGNETETPIDLSDSGTLSTATGDWNGFHATLGPFVVGYNTTAAYSLGGEIAYARIFNRYLSSAEINLLWRDWFAFDGDASVETDWQFCGADTEYDRSGNGYDITLQGVSASSGIAGIEGPQLPRPSTQIYVFASAAKQGASALDGSGALAAAANKTGAGSSSLSGAGSLASAAIKTAAGASSLDGSGALAAAANKTGTGASALNGTGALAAAAVKTAQGAASLSGTGSLNVTGAHQGIGGGGRGDSSMMKYTGATE